MILAVLAVIVAPVSGGTVDDVDVAVGQVLAGDGATCTGTVIAPGVVLTAAHCTETTPIGFELGGASYAAVAITVHPAFDAGTLASDLAIVTLDRDPGVTPVPLGTEDVAEGEAIQLVGFGRDGAGGTGVRRVAAVTVGALRGPTFAIDGSANACGGDSGGPSLRDGAIVGVVSSGAEACGATSEHVRVRAYLPWIVGVVPDAQVTAPVAPDGAPSVTITRPGDGATMPDTFVLGGEVSDDYGAIAVTVVVDGVAVASAAVTGDAVAVPIAVEPGARKVELDSVDGSGNVGRAQIALVIQPPLVDPGSAGAACWDDSDCTVGSCDPEQKVCAVGGGGCAIGGGGLGCVCLVLPLTWRRRRAKSAA